MSEPKPSCLNVISNGWESTEEGHGIKTESELSQVSIASVARFKVMLRKTTRTIPLDNVHA